MVYTHKYIICTRRKSEIYFIFGKSLILSAIFEMGRGFQYKEKAIFEQIQRRF